MPSYTLPVLQQRVLDRLDNNSQEFTPNQLTAAINEGLFRINCLTAYQLVTIPLITAQGVWLYPTPPQIMIPVRVDIEGFALQGPISLRRLAQEYRHWSTDTTDTQGPINRWCRFGLGQIIIHPADALGGLEMDVTGVPPTIPLAGVNDVAVLDNQFCEAVIIYASIRVQVKEPWQAFQRALQNVAELQRIISAISRWEAVRNPNWWMNKTQAEQKGLA